MAQLCTNQTLFERKKLMDDYISISMLNDFIFCPYSIYLHNVYMEADEGLFHATPQTFGRVAHESIDNKCYSTRKSDLSSISVISENLKLTGKIDLYKADRKLLIERKYRLKNIFRGQLYQLWAQYYCMLEMGFEVEHIAFYETSTNRMLPVCLPGATERDELQQLIIRFRSYTPGMQVKVNNNKCLHCIYCNLCDKTKTDNVYT